jgi:MscS family membrane protein
MLEWFFAQSYFGNSLFQVSLFFAAIVASLVVGKIVYYGMKKYLEANAEKSKTRADDFFVKVVQKPLIFFLLIVGIRLGTVFLAIPAEFAGTIDAIYGVLVTIGVTWVLVNVVDAVIQLYLAPIVSKSDSRLDDQLIPIVSKSVKWLIIIFAFLVIVSSFGYDVTAVLAGLGIGGLAVAFAAQATIAEIFGGLNILLSKPFIVKDWVKFNEIVGEVEKVSLRHTTIRNLDKRKVIIPNSTISSGIIENISSAPARKILMNLGLTYETPAAKLEKAIGIVKKIIDDHPDCEPEPIVQFSEFKDFSLNLLVIYYASNDKWFGVRHEINLAIKKAFDKAKIDFAYPTQLVYTAKA